MLAVTHLLFVLLFIRLLDLDGNEAFVALLFGVFIDLDHLMGMPEFIHQNGVASIADAEAFMTSDIQWKSLFHSPVAVLVVAPVAIAFRYMFPLLIWGSHLLMDWVQEAYLGLFSFAEIALLMLMLSIYGWIEYRAFMELPRSRFVPLEFMRWELSKLTNWFSKVLPGRSGRSTKTDL